MTVRPEPGARAVRRRTLSAIGVAVVARVTGTLELDHPASVAGAAADEGDEVVLS